MHEIPILFWRLAFPTFPYAFEAVKAVSELPALLQDRVFRSCKKNSIFVACKENLRWKTHIRSKYLMKLRALSYLFLAPTAYGVRRVVERNTPAISIPSMDSASSQTAGSASYQASSNMFSLDVGSIIPTPAASSSASGISQPVDYGMANQVFTGPSSSFTKGLSSYQVPAFTVSGCKPSANNGKCVKGAESNYGISLPGKFYKATSSYR
jgi:hypothetical protein